MNGFKDHFSDRSVAYAAFRPAYPDALFDFLAGIVTNKLVVWDCATGNGQAARSLARHFQSVIATDASASQLRQAFEKPNVHYAVTRAEAAGLSSESVGLVTVAQAFHWLDHPAFFQEVNRVLVPGGALAVWCYSMVKVTPAIDSIVDRFYRETLAGCWAPERKLVDDGYRSAAFPFRELPAPEFAIEQSIDLPGLAGYVHTWSAVKTYTQRHGVDPVGPLIETIGAEWGDPATRRPVRWPLHLRVGIQDPDTS